MAKVQRSANSAEKDIQANTNVEAVVNGSTAVANESTMVTNESTAVVNESTAVVNEATSVAPVTPVATTTIPTNGPSYDELLSIIKGLSQELNSLKTQMSAVSQANAVPSVPASQNNDITNQLLNSLVNRKTDRVVTIVHNRRCLGGLTTHLELTGISIDFSQMGERRAVSWQQFEECVSKYKSFFVGEVILLSDEHQDLAEEYGVPCVKRRGRITINRTDLEQMGSWSAERLADYVNNLSKQDKEFIFSYWLGKCYQKEKGYYDRYKIETLNSLSNGHVFDNMLVYMNGQSVLNAADVDTIKVN